jgi:hypothetical protein
VKVIWNVGINSAWSYQHSPDFPMAMMPSLLLNNSKVEVHEATINALLDRIMIQSTASIDGSLVSVGYHVQNSF